jgi:WASH complex subunit 7, N-terminal
VSLVQQLSAVLSERDTFHNEELNPNSKPALNTNALLSTHLFSVFTAIGDLLSVLLLFDYIIRNNEHLKEFWFAYKKLIETVKIDLNGYHTNSVEILKIEKALLFVDASLMKGKQLIIMNIY